jgi:uncharacterized protein YndB with AHSA1/START domain
MSNITQTEFAAVPARGTVVVKRVLPGPIDRVWAYLTEPEKRAKWFAGGAMDLRIGGEVKLYFDHSNITDEPTPEKHKCHTNLESLGHITQLESPRLLAYTWWEQDDDKSEIIFELTPQGSNVLLEITHVRLSDRGYMISVASGWQLHVDILEDILRERAKRPFWSRLEELKEINGGRITPEMAPESDPETADSKA